MEPREPQCYEHEAPGDLLHIDTKKLGRIERPSHHVTGNRRDFVDGAGWEFLFVAVDDHAWLAFTTMHPDERKDSAVEFLREAVAYYGKLGVTIKRLLTDNGSAERFIQSALREWAYEWTYQHSRQRTQTLASWQHDCNWHRPQKDIGGIAPASQLQASRKNLLTLHS